MRLGVGWRSFSVRMDKALEVEDLSMQMVLLRAISHSPLSMER